MDDLTPTQRLALRIQELEAELSLRDERIFYLAAEVARLRNGVKPTPSPLT